MDALIDHVIFAKNRDDLVAATRALDRVLLWNYYVVPQWTYGKVRTARWDRFARPEKLPEYGVSAFPTIWWFDPEKAAKVGSASVTLTRRNAIVVTAGSLAAASGWLRTGGSRRRRTSRHVGVRRPEISADFRHFDYVNPAAPKGGTFSQIGPSRQFNQNFLTFNSLNSYILKGDAAQGMELTFATLMARAGGRARRDVWFRGARRARFPPMD